MRKLKHVILPAAVLITCSSCGGDGQSASTPAAVAAAVKSPAVGTNEINDTDPAVIYSRGNNTTKDWNYFQPAAADFQQDEHSSNLVRGGGAITGVGAVVNFSGTGITWIGKKGPNYGKVSYSIDGGSPQTIDNYNSTESDQIPIATVTGLSAESHVLSITLLDQKNAAASDYWQTLDAFQISGSTLTATQGTVAGYGSSELVFTGQWDGGLVSDGTDLSGGHHWSNTANSSVSWTFVGSLIEVFGRPDYENGYMDVYIDNKAVASVNGHWGQADDDSLNAYMLYAAKVAPGQHTIKLVVSGKKDDTSRDIYVQLDEFIAFQ